jgi:hypothetical protein
MTRDRGGSDEDCVRRDKDRTKEHESCKMTMHVVIMKAQWIVMTFGIPGLTEENEFVGSKCVLKVQKVALDRMAD